MPSLLVSTIESIENRTLRLRDFSLLIVKMASKPAQELDSLPLRDFEKY